MLIWLKRSEGFAWKITRTFLIIVQSCFALKFISLNVKSWVGMFEITCPTHQHQTLTPVMLYFVQIDCLLGDFGAKKKVFKMLLIIYSHLMRDQ